MGDAMQTILLPFSCKESSDRCRTHLEEESPGFLINAQMPMVHEVLHKEGHACCQTDRTKEGTGCPGRDKLFLDCRAIPGRTMPVNMLARIRHQETISQQVPLSYLVRDPGRISPTVLRGLTEVIEHL